MQSKHDQHYVKYNLNQYIYNNIMQQNEYN